MALAGESELFRIMSGASVPYARRAYRYESTMPFVHDDHAPPGCTWAFDYQWEQESADDAPMVLVTAARLMSHRGPEYAVSVRDLDPRWVAEIESLISDDLEAQP